MAQVKLQALISTVCAKFHSLLASHNQGFSIADPLHCFLILLSFIDKPFSSTPKALLIVPIESLDAPNNSSNSGPRIQKVIDVSAVVNTNLTRLVLSDEKLKALLAITGRMVSNIERIANY
jgi:hypothetical protein